MESELILTKGGLPPLSARGCIQQLFPLESGELRRTINGVLIYTGQPLVHKYRSIITCEDKASLAFEGLWRGSELLVGCVQRLWQESHQREVILERDPVEGSIFAVNSKQKVMKIREVVGRKVSVEGGGTEQIFICYRPWLKMRVVSFTLSTNEWGLTAGWRLELEEV